MTKYFCFVLYCFVGFDWRSSIYLTTIRLKLFVSINVFVVDPNECIVLAFMQGPITTHFNKEVKIKVLT
jgi:hypothetical protein